MPRYAAKVDRNQGEIAGDLRKLGYRVYVTHRLGEGYPDLMCGGKRTYVTDLGGKTFRFTVPHLLLVEIKAPGKEEELTDKEVKFMREWRGFPVIVAERTEDVLEWFKEQRI